MDIFEAIARARIVPVVTIESAEHAVPIAEALRAGGLNLIEVTLRTPEALACIRRIREALPDMPVGAGTILDAAQVDAATEAGAQFGVAPGLNEIVVERARACGLPFMPGVATASEVERALYLGCRLLKFFPASLAGGCAMLKAFAGPYAHTGARFVPLGGIRPETMAEYLKLPIVAAIGGSWLVDPAAVRAGRFEAVADAASAACRLAAEAVP